MPDKWAVKIESPKEAEQLRSIFPKDTDPLANPIDNLYHKYEEQGVAYLTPSKQKGRSGQAIWGYMTEFLLLKHDYTIYTLSQLKELLQ
jgi:hypothetical protein